MDKQTIYICVVAFCLVRAAYAADKLYGVACTVGTDTCTNAKTECKADATGTTKCICKSGIFYVDNAAKDNCECKATYTESGSTCKATIGTTVCTTAGTECSTSTSSYCDATALKCKCPLHKTAGANDCTDKSCTAGTECTTLDANSECASSKCACKSGYKVGTDGKCAGGAAGVFVSTALVMLCVLTTLF